MNDSLKTRDYDLKSIESDPRFVQSKKEFWIAFVLGTVPIAIMLVLMYGVNWGPAAEFTYIASLPAWCFYLVLTYLVGLAIWIVFALKGIRDVPMDDLTDEGGKEGNR
jgi:uncharacterized membrane protein YhdT